MESAHATSSGARSRARGELHAEEPPARRGEQLALLHEERGEEHDQEDLGELAGLDGEDAQPQPDLRPVDLGDRRRQQAGQREQHQPGEARRVAVAGQRAVVAHEEQHGDEQRQPDRRPRDLPPDQDGGGIAAERRGALGVGEVQPVDHDEAQPVEQRHAGQDQRVGVRREPAHGHVREREEGEVREPHPQQRLGERLLLVGLDEHERDRDEHRRERQQHQLDAPPRRRGGRVGRGGPGPVAAR
jgi:hypothetical protein